MLFGVRIFYNGGDTFFVQPSLITYISIVQVGKVSDRQVNSNSKNYIKINDNASLEKFCIYQLIHETCKTYPPQMIAIYSKWSDN